MRSFLTTTIGILAVTATTASAETTCASLYILCARGSGEFPVSINNNYPYDTGSPGYLAVNITHAISGSAIGGVDYPAEDPEKGVFQGPLYPEIYYPSENTGAKAIVEEVNQYVSACPNSKIALMGYSQGAQIVRDALCGGLGGHFNSDAPLSPDLVKKNIIAVALFGDPSRVANQTIDRGTSQHNGLFPRTNTTVCDQYNDITASWCDDNDRFCDSGKSDTVHASYLSTYGKDIQQFVIDGWKKSTSQSGSGLNATGAIGTGTMGSPTITAAPTGSQSHINSASSLVLSDSLLLKVVVLLSILLY